jgi:hypothetical protein
VASRAASFFMLALAVGVLAAACSDPSPTGPGPGGTPPGQSCSTAKDCGCWQCNCVGVSGQPGAAQLCVDDKCPTGEAACTPICALANAQLASATAVDQCNGVP